MCSQCSGERLLRVNAKCGDLCHLTGDKEQDGYVPDNIGIGGGDYISFTYCLDCGQIQGDFPIPKAEEDGN